MKNLLLLLGMVLLSSGLFAQAENSNYYIEGDFEAKVENGKFKYELSNIVYKGVSSISGNFLSSYTTEEGSVVFTFEGAKTNCPAQFTNVRFWKWQNSKWQKEGETKKGTPKFQSTKEMSMVLVLDYSSSIGTDFDKLKQSAVKFIENIYVKSPNGNVKIGIVLFNTMDNTDKMIYPIKGLDGNTKSEMIRFIRSPDIKKNTALYYAMKKGVNMLENYSKNISSDKYDGSYLITFTDGIDNQSMDATLGAPTDGKADPYFQHIKSIISSKRIKGKKIESHIIAVQGDDVGDNLLFKSILEDLSNNFILAENFDQVNATFAKIANELINKWQDLDCYVPPRFKGKVRWTLDDESDYVPPIIKKEVKKSSKTNFIMLNSMLMTAPLSAYYSNVKNWGFYVGFGYGTETDYEYYDFTTDDYYTYPAFSVYGGVARKFGSSNFYGNAGGVIYLGYDFDLMLDIATLYKFNRFSVRTGFGIGIKHAYFSLGAGITF